MSAKSNGVKKEQLVGMNHNAIEALEDALRGAIITHVDINNDKFQIYKGLACDVSLSSGIFRSVKIEVSAEGSEGRTISDVWMNPDGQVVIQTYEERIKIIAEEVDGSLSFVVADQEGLSSNSYEIISAKDTPNLNCLEGESLIEIAYRRGKGVLSFYQHSLSVRAGDVVVNPSFAPSGTNQYSAPEEIQSASLEEGRAIIRTTYSIVKIIPEVGSDDIFFTLNSTAYYYMAKNKGWYVSER